MRYGHAIRVARASRGITQKKLGALAGVDGSFVSLIEAGKRNPGLDVLGKFCAAMRLPLYLLTILATEEGDLFNSTSAKEMQALGSRLLVALTDETRANAADGAQ